MINKTADKEGLLNEDIDERISEGVDIEVGIKQILASVYNGVPLRLLSIFIR